MWDILSNNLTLEITVKTWVLAYQDVGYLDRNSNSCELYTLIMNESRTMSLSLKSISTLFQAFGLHEIHL